MLIIKASVFLLLIITVNCAVCPFGHGIHKRQSGDRPRSRNENSRDNDNNDSNQRNSNNNNNNNNQENRDSQNDRNNDGKDRRPKTTSSPQIPITSSNCNPNKRYSEIDGSCNNLFNPTLGRAETSFKRYLPAEYEDNISKPRIHANNGQQLPNPRLISRELMNDNSKFESDYSDLLVYFGQFLAHDLTEFKESELNNEHVECPCGSTNPLCLSYEVPNGDNQISQSCFEFTRAQIAPSTFTSGFEATNFLTSFIDATNVYGASEEICNGLRSFSNGQLRTSQNNYLPESDEFVCDPNGKLKCFDAGDDRTSENLALTSIHLLFMREHNRIADELSKINKHWDDETLFQEARKINIASMQHIIYNEWLPEIIGSKIELLPQSSGYYTGYSNNINPAISNEFATSAFRFGHTLIRQQLDRYNLQLNNVHSPVNLSSIIFNSQEAYNTNFGLGGIESIFMGLLAQPTSKFDANIVDTLQNHLFEFKDENGNTIALDLAATNINRGRDMALPAYHKYRELCGSRTINDFNDLRDVMTTNNINNLRSIYSSVKDIDLFVGSLHESSDSDALVGPTIACILEKQFEDLKRGDRFYYENGPSATSFSTEQLNEIRKVTMSGLICNNFRVNRIQQKAFKMPYSSLNNEKTHCLNIADIDFDQWRN